jgi:glycosyltransferase involved in cell wall biosynthesis
VRVALHLGQLLQPVPGGIGRYTEALGAALPEAGVQVQGFAAGTLSQRRRAIFPDYVDLGWPGGSARYELWHRLRRPALPVRADVVHAPSLAVPPPGPRPLVVTVHDVAFLRHPDAFTRRGLGFHRRGLEIAYHEARTVVTASDFSRDELRRVGFEDARIHVVPHGVQVGQPEADDVIERRLHRVGVTQPFVVCVGTLEPRKGHDTLIAAFQAARRELPDLTLALVGPRGWLTVPGLEGAGMHELGKVDEATLDALYRRCTVCAVPSRYEGFGLPALEAMARAATVVAADSTSLPEIVGDAGVLLPPLDVQAWANAIVELTCDDAARKELGERALQRAHTFSWEDSARAHAEVYAAALSAPARP